MSAPFLTNVKFGSVVRFMTKEGKDDYGVVNQRVSEKSYHVYDRRGHNQQLVRIYEVLPSHDLPTFQPANIVMYDPKSPEVTPFITRIYQHDRSAPNVYIILPAKPTDMLLKHIPCISLTRVSDDDLEDIDHIRPSVPVVKMKRPPLDLGDVMLQGSLDVGHVVAFRGEDGQKTLGVVVDGAWDMPRDTRLMRVMDSTGQILTRHCKLCVRPKKFEHMPRLKENALVRYQRLEGNVAMVYDTRIISYYDHFAHLPWYMRREKPPPPTTFYVLAEVPHKYPYRVPITALTPLEGLPPLDDTAPLPPLPPVPTAEEDVAIPKNTKRQRVSVTKGAPKKKRLYTEPVKEELDPPMPPSGSGSRSKVMTGGATGVSSVIKAGDAVRYRYTNGNMYPGIVVETHQDTISVIDEVGRIHTKQRDVVMPMSAVVPRFQINQAVEYDMNHDDATGNSRYATRIHSLGVYPNTYNVVKEYDDVQPYLNVAATALKAISPPDDPQSQYDSDVASYLRDHPAFQEEIATNRRRLMVKLSTLNTPTDTSAGLGLFALEGIPKGEFLGMYRGVVTTPRLALNPRSCFKYELFQPSETNKYTGKNGLIIDAGQIYKDNVVKFANDCHTLKDALCYNARFETLGNDHGVLIPVIKATHNIAPGTEIFVSYSRAFWETHKDLECPELVPTLLRVLQHDISPATKGENAALLKEQLKATVQVPASWMAVIREVFYDFVKAGKGDGGLGSIKSELLALAARCSPLRPLIVAYDTGEFLSLCVSAAPQLADWRTAMGTLYDSMSPVVYGPIVARANMLEAAHPSTFPLDHMIPPHGLWGIVLMRDFSHHQMALTRQEMLELTKPPRTAYHDMYERYKAATPVDRCLYIVRLLKGKVQGIRFTIKTLPFGDQRIVWKGQTGSCFHIPSSGWDADATHSGWRQLAEAITRLLQ